MLGWVSFFLASCETKKEFECVDKPFASLFIDEPLISGSLVLRSFIPDCVD